MIERPQASYLLHSRPYKEHQIIVDLLTEFDGKVSAITYSGKTPKSNKKSILQPFLPLNVTLSGRNALKKIKHIEACGKSFNLTGNYLYSSFYLNELSVKLLPELIPCDMLFQQYNDSLEQLNDKQGIEPILRAFELVLLDELGLSLDFSPVFEHPDCQSPLKTWFRYKNDEGFTLHDLTPSNDIYDKEHLQCIAKGDFFSPEVLRTSKRLMRQVIDHILGHKRLNSRDLFVKRDK